MGGTVRSSSPRLRKRAREIYEIRRRALYVTADRTFLRLLPIQWLGSCVLTLLKHDTQAPAGICASGLNPWIAIALSGLINGGALALIRYQPGCAATRRVVGASLALFYLLLLCVAAGSFETRLYLFVALGFLAFYRDLALLVAVGSAGLLAQYAYGVVACARPDAVGGYAPQRFLEFGFWAILEACVLGLVCHSGTRLFRTNAREAAQLELDRAEEHRQVLERTRQLEASNEQYRALLESTSAVPWELDDGSGACTYIGAQVERQWGWPSARFQQNGFLFTCVHPEDRPAFAQALEDAVASHDVAVEYRMILPSGQFAHVRSFIRHTHDKHARRIVRGISIDVTMQRKLESELHQAQKLESVGRLAAGVAHEINTPVQFVNDSCYFLRDAITQVRTALTVYRDAVEAVAAGSLDPSDALTRVREAEQTADLTFLDENMPAAVERSLEGLERVTAIVQSMKEFSHPDQDAPSWADLNAAIRSTLTIARSEYKYVADVETDFGEISPVVCYIGELNQAFLNIVVNAAHAIGDVVAGTDRKGLITVTTRQEGDQVIVWVRDTGGGIPAEIRGKVFDPFFTTKEVGKGTGQGLSVARSVIVDKHRGSLTFETQQGVGTTFVVRLPVDSTQTEQDGCVAA
jgi:PAS domain S-box-containing protein